MTENNKTALEEHGNVPEAPTQDNRSGAQKARDRKNQQNPPTATPSGNKNKAMLSAAIAISLASLSVSGWLLYQAQHNNTTAQLAVLKSQQSDIHDQLNAYNQSRAQINQLAEQVQGTEQRVRQQTNSIVDKQDQQTAQIRHINQTLSQLHNTTKEDWKLAEAEYLVRLANQRILLQSDAKGSEGLLANADSILAELQDPMFFEARKAIAQDIQALKSTRHFDLQGRYLQLGALYDQVPKLPQREPSKAWQKSNKKNSPEQANTVVNKVTGVLSEMWHSLKSLVIINYNHKPIKALLPPTEYQQLITGLQLQVDVAQVAMVKGETQIYQNALSRVAKAVTEHFDTNSQSVTAFLSSITSLQQVNPAPKLPLPHHSLEAMKKLMAAWNERSLAPEPHKQNNAEKGNQAPQEKLTPKQKTLPQSKQGDQA